MNNPENTTEAQIKTIFTRQRQTALALRTSDPAQRRAKLRALERAVETHRQAIYQALAADLHKPEAEADLNELLPVISEIRHAARHLKSWMKPRGVAPTLAMLGTSGKIRYEPKGTALIIAPWNYPFNLAIGPLVSAIAAGNTAIVKPSELTPATSAVIGKIIRETFDPAEICVLEGDAALSTALLDLPFDHIFFTGSPAVGKIVMAAAAKNLTSVTLELGGKSPVIVDASANLDKAAAWIAWGKFANGGQTCNAPDHLFVHESVLPGLVERLKARIHKMYGDDAETSPDYCRIVNERHFARVKQLIDDAVARGAILATGGHGKAADKYIAPTLLIAPPPESPVMQEEIFGPVLPIISFGDIAEPIAAINAKPKPLALYIFSKTRRTVNEIISRTSAGGTGVNLTLLQFVHNNLPFGGVNNSGIGGGHGYFGFKAFSHERAVLKDIGSVTPILFPPYGKRVMFMIKATIRWFT